MARGRPPIEINQEVLEAMMQYGATCLDCAGRFMCTTDTIVNYIKANYDMNFSELSDKMMHGVRLKLRERMFRAAMDGNTAMMIWLSKQWLGMKDHIETETSIKDKIEIVIK